MPDPTHNDSQVRAADVNALAAHDKEGGRSGGAFDDPFVILLILVLIAGGVILVAPRILWRIRPEPADRVLLVNYTVPFVSGREHRGAIWLLNHLKYRSANGRAFDLLATHVGYDPVNRDTQTTLAEQDLSKVDWVYVTDTYGVYEDDLRDPEQEMAHMDRSAKIFGAASSSSVRIWLGIVRNTAPAPRFWLKALTRKRARPGISNEKSTSRNSS